MNYRFSKIFAEKSYAADATEIIDLNVVDPISQLIIACNPNYASAALSAHPIACLKKVELVDGSDVLMSLSGYEAEALDIYHSKKMRSNFNTQLGSMGVERFVHLNFGRKLWDKEFAFDPGKFKNPQLKISLDLDASGGGATSILLSVLAAMFDEKTISPTGFLMSKEIKEYSMASGAHEYTDLPTDFPYRKLLIKALTHGAEPGAIIENIKLSEDQDKRIIFNDEPENLLRTLAADNQELEEQIIFAATTSAKNVYTTVSARATAVIMDWAAAMASTGHTSYGSAGGRMVAYAQAATNAIAHIRGWLPHGVYELPFGDQEDPEDWFDVMRVGSLKLDIKAFTGRSSSDVIQIFLQQLRNY